MLIYVTILKSILMVFMSKFMLTSSSDQEIQIGNQAPYGSHSLDALYALLLLRLSFVKEFEYGETNYTYRRVGTINITSHVI